MISFKEEKKFWKLGHRVVVGLDEAGRGPLAGPVVAAAVTVREPKKCDSIKKQLLGINDSKKLSEAKREKMYQLISDNPFVDFGVGVVSETVIDDINILQATKLAMQQALENLAQKNSNYASVNSVIIDGNFMLDKMKNAGIIQKPIVKADQTVFSCVMAGIVAKVTRDKLMKQYHQEYPEYGFDQHKGYGTSLHIKNIEKYGLCSIHRKTFHPIKSIIATN